MPLTPESLYMRLGDLIRSMPDLLDEPGENPDTISWLARAYALVAASGASNDAQLMKMHTNYLLNDRDPETRHLAIRMILHRALAIAELNAPTAIQGAFIPAGNAFDAMAAVGKVLSQATQDLLIVDPYMDEKVLTDFAGLAPPGVTLRLMADQQSHKLTLKPAVLRWATQHATARPVEARLAAPRSLHDRLIVVDGADAWTLTQSFNALAARSPASIVRVDAETAALKAAAYEGMWQAASPL